MGRPVAVTAQGAGYAGIMVRVFISYVTMEFPSPAETFASNEVRFLSATGHRVAVHALRPAHPDADKMVRDRGLSGVAMSHNGPAASLVGLLAEFKRPRLLWRTLVWLWHETAHRRLDLVKALGLLPRAFAVLDDLRRDPPDVVHIYWGHYPAVVGYLVHNEMPDVVLTIGLSAYDLVSRFGPSVTVAHKAAFVKTQAAVNIEDIKAFTGLTDDRIEVVYNGVDLERIAASSAGIERSPRQLITVGRLEPGKAMEDVLQAFASVVAVVPAATLRVLGDGSQREALERLADQLGIGNSVRFEGHLEHSRVIATMAASEALLFLSRSPSERLPNVVKEAMACGCVCVTTRTPGIEELVIDGVTGFLVDPGDVAGSAARITSLLNGELDTKQMRGRARAHIEESFDLRRTAGRLASLWETTLNSRRHS